MRPCVTSSGYRNTDLGDHVTPSQGAGLIVLSMGDGILTHLSFRSTQQYCEVFSDLLIILKFLIQYPFPMEEIATIFHVKYLQL
jgi:hypothetical protein